MDFVPAFLDFARNNISVQLFLLKVNHPMAKTGASKLTAETSHSPPHLKPECLAWIFCSNIIYCWVQFVKQRLNKNLWSFTKVDKMNFGKNILCWVSMLGRNDLVAWPLQVQMFGTLCVMEGGIGELQSFFSTLRTSWVNKQNKW